MGQSCQYHSNYISGYLCNGQFLLKGGRGLVFSEDVDVVVVVVAILLLKAFIQVGDELSAVKCVLGGVWIATFGYIPEPDRVLPCGLPIGLHLGSEVSSVFSQRYVPLWMVGLGELAVVKCKERKDLAARVKSLCTGCTRNTSN